MIAGVLVSLVLIYLSVSKVSFGEIASELCSVNYYFLVPPVLLFTFTTFLKSLRMGFLLSPIEKLHQKVLFPITCVGYAFTALLPFRIGEVVRPYLISRKSNIPVDTALSSTLLERLLDVFALLVILFLFIFTSEHPAWIARTAYSAFAIFLLTIFLVFLLRFQTDLTLKLIWPLLNLLPAKIADKSRRVIANFAKGLDVLCKPKAVAPAILISLLIWIIGGAGIYSLFYFQSLQLPLRAAYLVQMTTVFGVSLPTAPGMLGNFHYGCIVALQYWDVPKDSALLFSLVYYLAGVGVNVLIAIIFFFRMKIPYKNLNMQTTIGS